MPSEEAGPCQSHPELVKKQGSHAPGLMTQGPEPADLGLLPHWLMFRATESTLTLKALQIGDVHTVLSSPALLSSRRRTHMAFTESVHLLCGPLRFRLSSIFPSITVLSDKPCLPHIFWGLTSSANPLGEVDQATRWTGNPN